MNITINKQQLEIPEGSTVAYVAQQQGVAEGKGVAIAMNGTVVRRDAWPTTEVPENASIVVIKAAYGG